MSQRPPKPPKDLQKAGESLWKAITADVQDGWRLDARELHLLGRACKVEDELCELERVLAEEGLTTPGSRGQTAIHPAAAEARQLLQTQQRLLGAIELADPSATKSANSVHASRAAQARWAQAS